MAGKYSQLYKAVDLIGRTIPKRGAGTYSSLLVHKFIDFLKILDLLQTENAFITIAAQTGGSIAIYYKGLQLCGLQPHTTHIRLGIRIEPKNEDRQAFISLINDSKNLFEYKIEFPYDAYPQWRCKEGELDVIMFFLKGLPSEVPADLILRTHPRDFPGELRARALEEFQRTGRWCPGVGRKKHQVDLSVERIEFDHVLPHSKGGSRSEHNIQILCAECNRRKGPTAL